MTLPSMTMIPGHIPNVKPTLWHIGLHTDFHRYEDLFTTADIDHYIALANWTPTSKWETGRQNTGYEKLALNVGAERHSTIERSLALLDYPAFFDACLIRYRHGAHVPLHKDDGLPPGVIHRRLNVLLQAPRAGGRLTFVNAGITLLIGDGVLFRPDITEHSVSTVYGSIDRLVFSVGCWERDNSAR